MGIRRLGRWLGRAVLAGFALWAFTFAALVAYGMFVPARAALPDDPAEVIICLGAGVTDDPVAPLAGRASERRALRCAEVYAAGLAPLVLFTGAAADAPISTAAAMADVAMAAGVPREAVIVEPRAMSTIQNAAFGLALLPEPPKRAILVSDAFHLPRAGVIFRAFGVADPVPVATVVDGRTLMAWQAREAAAIWFNLARLAVFWAGGAVGIDAETRIDWFN